MGKFVGASLGELLEREPIKSFRNELWEKFTATLGVATEFTRGLTDPPHSIEVSFTGGAKGLPMVQAIRISGFSPMA